VVNLYTGTGKLPFFGLYVLEEGSKEQDENFYEKSQNILNKTKKTYYILLAGGLNARRGNAEIHNIVGNSGEPVTNTSGWKLTDCATFNNMKITNSFHKHKNIHSYTWSARNSKTFIHYTIANRKLSQPFLDTRVYRGSDTVSDQILLYLN
jgi:hypothetical protein